MSAILVLAEGSYPKTGWFEAVVLEQIGDDELKLRIPGVCRRRNPGSSTAISWRSCRLPDDPMSVSPRAAATFCSNMARGRAAQSSPLFSSSFAILNLTNPASWAAVDDARPGAINGGAHVRPDKPRSYRQLRCGACSLTPAERGSRSATP